MTEAMAKPAASYQVGDIKVSASVAYQDLGFLAVLGLSARTFTVSHQQIHIGE